MAEALAILEKQVNKRTGSKPGELATGDFRLERTDAVFVKPSEFRRASKEAP
jgi:hypothetical protein